MESGADLERSRRLISVPVQRHRQAESNSQRQQQQRVTDVSTDSHNLALVRLSSLLRLMVSLHLYV